MGLCTQRCHRHPSSAAFNSSPPVSISSSSSKTSLNFRSPSILLVSSTSRLHLTLLLSHLLNTRYSRFPARLLPSSTSSTFQHRASSALPFIRMSEKQATEMASTEVKDKQDVLSQEPPNKRACLDAQTPSNEDAVRGWSIIDHSTEPSSMAQGTTWSS